MRRGETEKETVVEARCLYGSWGTGRQSSAEVAGELSHREKERVEIKNESWEGVRTTVKRAEPTDETLDQVSSNEREGLQIEPREREHAGNGVP